MDEIIYVLTGTAPSVLAGVIGAAGVVWAVGCGWLDRAGRPAPPALAIAPLVALVALLPVGGLWIERVQLESLRASSVEGLGAWSRIKGNAWGIFPGVVALTAVPPALGLLLGCRRVGARWHSIRTAWAAVLMLGGAVLSGLLLFEWLDHTHDTLFMVYAALVLAGLRGPWLLTRCPDTPEDRRTQETVAITLVAVVALWCASITAAGHVEPFVCPGPLGAESVTTVRAARAAAQDKTWAVGLLISTVVALPLCTEGLRRRGAWVLAAAVVIPTLAVSWPAWVRERELPELPIADLLPPYESEMLSTCEP